MFALDVPFNGPALMLFCILTKGLDFVMHSFMTIFLAFVATYDGAVPAGLAQPSFTFSEGTQCQQVPDGNQDGVVPAGLAQPPFIVAEGTQVSQVLDGNHAKEVLAS